MAHVAMAGVPGNHGPGPGPGPMEAVASPPSQSLSRYRALRGKSMSLARDFNVFQDDNGSAGSAGNPGSDESCDSWRHGPPASRSSSLGIRSRSMTSFRRALKRQECVSVCEVPPLPRKTKVLCPKPINVTAQSKLKMLEKLKSPALLAEHAPWKSLAGVHVGESESASKSASRTDTTRCQVDVQDDDKTSGDGSGGGPTRTMALEPPHTHQTRGLERLDSSSLETPLESSLDASLHHDVPQGGGLGLGTPSTEASHARDQPASQSSDSEAIEAPVSEPTPAQPSARPIAAPSHAPDSGTRSGGQELLTHEVARLEAETDRILAEQKKLDLARLQTQFVTHPKPKRLILPKLSFFSRTTKRATVTDRVSQPSTRPSTAGTPSTIVSAIFSPTLSHYSLESSSEEPPTPSVSVPVPVPNKMSFIEPGGKGIVPQKDAPVSAINGGERRVVVRCLSSTINLPVTADTSPVDILTAAAQMTRHQLTPATCVIIECYTVLGLERRLRRYERIRDVMNSWDRDLQNSLLVMPCDTVPNDEHHLEMESVPRTEEPPAGFSMQMYHSSKPGKWNKRWVTLLDNGQIYAAKSVNAQPCDKDCSVLCHLTDFDIYTPKESEMRRRLRPPKRFCYAIKSQQKTVVFPNGENFVHFFSTEDPQEAALFYQKVQGWRSWYMVNRMVDLGEKKKKAPQPMLDVGKIKKNNNNSSSSSSSSSSNNMRNNDKHDTSDSNVRNNMSSLKTRNNDNNKNDKRIIKNGHEAGEKVSSRADRTVAEPLMDVNEFRMSKVIIDDAQLQKALSIRSKASTRAKTASLSREISKSGSEGEPEFSVGGLLGDAYEKRKQAEAAASASPSVKHVDGPFTEAPSLLNGGIPKTAETPKKQVEQGGKTGEPRSWFPSAAEHSARTRHTTHHHQQQQQRRPMTAVDTPASFPSPPTNVVVSSSTTGCLSRRERHPAPLLSFKKDVSETSRFQSGFHSAGVRSPPRHPLINFTASGSAARDVRDVRDAREVAVKRHSSRRSSSGGLALVAAVPPAPQYPPPPPVAGLQRPQSSLKPGANSQRRHFPGDSRKSQFVPPVPPVPPLSLRRMHHGGAPSRPPSRCPPEPLVNRAR
ncbi:hypothetical protein E4U55_004818 [Claviceps digitariae]|nr:hypothetical protein E4U55_004818 [Claviceps digitariae]